MNNLDEDIEILNQEIFRLNLLNHRLKDTNIKLVNENHDLKQKLENYIPRRRVRRIYKQVGKILKQDGITDDLEEEFWEELETYKKIAERYERECRMFRAFCRRIRKDEKRNVDEFNQGREYAYIQFLNLISGEQNWEHEGKYFDEVDKELLDWARKEVENENNNT